MKNNFGHLAAPFPYFGGKSAAANTVWAAFGVVDNYVEPFAGSAAMLLAAPPAPPNRSRTETINGADGFVANFWRSIAHDPDAVAHHADWPVNEIDLHARHGWLVNRSQRLKWSLEDPDFFDAKVAGWWVWGLCNWIGSGWCSGDGPWQSNGAHITKFAKGGKINPQDFEPAPLMGEGVLFGGQLPYLSEGRGINRQLPHVGNAGQGINRAMPSQPDQADQQAEHPRTVFIREWMRLLHHRLKHVRVACGDWGRVVKDSVTTRHGTTAVFLDPPYTKGAMDYAAGGVGTTLPLEVQAWCAENGHNPLLRIVLCGHAGEHDALLNAGWHLRTWTARKGYAQTDEARQNSQDETLWCSPHCLPEVGVQVAGLFDAPA